MQQEAGLVQRERPAGGRSTVVRFPKLEADLYGEWRNSLTGNIS